MKKHIKQILALTLVFLIVLPSTIALAAEYSSQLCSIISSLLSQNICTDIDVEEGDILAYYTTKTRDIYVKLGTINELEGFTRTDTKAETTAMVSYTYKADDETSPINYVSVSGSPLQAESLTQSSMLQLPSYGYTVGEMHETEVQGYKAYVYSSTIAYYQEPEQTADAAAEATAEPAADEAVTEPAADEAATEPTAEPAAEEPAADPENNTFVQDITMYVDCENDHTLALHVTLKGADESVYVAEDALTDYLKPFTEAFTLLPKTAEAK
ncbi:MAG: hypothetical protein Q4D43_04605 [Clostridia bacterium]|nr:hypothetical protein [Clostridia bacterium]